MDILCSVVHPVNLVMNNEALFILSISGFHVLKPHTDAFHCVLLMMGNLQVSGQLRRGGFVR